MVILTDVVWLTICAYGCRCHSVELYLNLPADPERWLVVNFTADCWRIEVTDADKNWRCNATVALAGIDADRGADQYRSLSSERCRMMVRV